MSGQSDLRERIALMNGTGLGRFLRIFNMLNGAAVIAAGVAIHFVDPPKFDISDWLASGYVVFFGLLLILFELRIKTLQATIARYCGFMFSSFGRALYLIFMGTLCIGLKYPGYIAAGVSYLNVIINFCILSYNPEVRQQYLEQNEKYRLKPGKKSAAQKIVDYGIENPEHAKNAARIIAENPEAAQKAAKFASENPELAKAALDSAV